MRIVYGIHGYGRGHATRALAVLPHLAQRHQLLILAGGDAYQALIQDYPVIRIPTLGFAYGRGAGPRQRSNWHTLRRNLPAVLDLFLGGPVFDMVRALVADFGPDVAIADAETWTHQVAAALKIPRISFDHIGILAYCRPVIPPGDRWETAFDTACYRRLMGKPQRIIVSSFFPAPPRFPGVAVVGTLPRAAVRDLASTPGNYLLAYFNKGREQLHAAMLQALNGVGCPVHVYGSDRRGRHEWLHFLPPSDMPFLEDLAGCRAVLSTAGNQLIGEAIHLGKPVLVMPERCVEQRLNAAAVEMLGIGQRVPTGQLTAGRIRAFLDQTDDYTARLSSCNQDGLEEALATLDRFLDELAPGAASRRISALATA